MPFAAADSSSSARECCTTAPRPTASGSATGFRFSRTPAIRGLGRILTKWPRTPTLRLRGDARLGRGRRQGGAWASLARRGRGRFRGRRGQRLLITHRPSELETPAARARLRRARAGALTRARALAAPVVALALDRAGRPRRRRPGQRLPADPVDVSLGHRPARRRRRQIVELLTRAAKAGLPAQGRGDRGDATTSAPTPSSSPSPGSTRSSSRPRIATSGRTSSSW